MKRYCQFKDSLGKPNKGFHKFQAIGDWFLTIILALVFGGITYAIINKVNSKENTKQTMPFLGIVFFWFISLVFFAIFLHYLFCVDTRLNVSLGIKTPVG